MRDDPPVLRPYGDWLIRTHLLIVEGAPEDSPSCFALPTGTRITPGICGLENLRARTERDMSRLVVVDDLQANVRTKMAGLVQ
jgi:hypothetical protein